MQDTSVEEPKTRIEKPSQGTLNSHHLHFKDSLGSNQVPPPHITHSHSSRLLLAHSCNSHHSSNSPTTQFTLSTPSPRMSKANSINVKSAARLGSTNVGRHGPFTKEQVLAIEKHFNDWHDFAFVKHPTAGGRGTSAVLTKWKQDKAKLIMEGSEFTTLPDSVSLLI
jgi:hypothetical protein